MYGIIDVVELARDYNTGMTSEQIKQYERLIKMNNKITYEATIKITAVFDVSEIGKIKSNSEFAQDMATLVCDEVTTAGGVAMYEVIESKIDVE